MNGHKAVQAMTDTEQSFYFVLFGLIFFGFVAALFAMGRSKKHRDETASEMKKAFEKDPIEALLNISFLITVPLFFGWLFFASIDLLPMGQPFMWLVCVLFVQFILLFVIPNRKR